MGTHTDNESSFEHRGRVVRHWLRSNRRFDSSTTFARMAVQNSTAASDRLTERTCGVQAKRARSNETHRAEDAHSGGVAENVTTSYPQCVDSRQPGRPHDQGHDSREADQVWTCSELARIILRKLGPPCIAFTTHRNSYSRDEHSQQLSQSQTHRILGKLGTMREKNSSQLSTQNNDASAT